LRAPSLPSVGLDPSWQLALSEAAVRHFRFGTDVLFSYGPLGFLMDGAATPQTVLEILSARIVLAMLFGFLVAWRLMECNSWPQAVIFLCATLIGTAATGPYPDSISFYVLVLVFTLPAFTSEKAPLRLAAAVGLLSGLMALTKVTLAIDALTLASATFCIRFIGHRGARQLRNRDALAFAVFLIGYALASAAFICAQSYGTILAALLSLVSVTGLGLFVVSQSGRDLSSKIRSASANAALVISAALALALTLTPASLHYWIGSFQIAAGYSAAMSLDGSTNQLVIAVTGILLVAGVASIGLREFGLARSATLTLALWLMFKAGFVRQDGHVEFFFACFVFVSGLTVLTATRMTTVVLAFLSTAVAIFSLSAVNANLGYERIVGRFANPANAVASIQTFYAFPRGAQLVSVFDRNLRDDRLPPKLLRHVADGTSDAVPTEQALEFANRLDWAPAPVFQSYSAYTPYLDALNEHRLKTGPRHLLLEYGSIDGRYPPSDEPASFRRIICSYAPATGAQRLSGLSGGQELLVLDRVGNRCAIGQVLKSRDINWDEFTTVDTFRGLVFAKLDIKYSPIGELMRVLFRVAPVNITIVRADGRAESFRIPSEVASDGILISPAVFSANELSALLRQHPGPPAKYIRLSSEAPLLFSKSIHFTTVAYVYN